MQGKGDTQTWPCKACYSTLYEPPHRLEDALGRSARLSLSSAEGAQCSGAAGCGHPEPQSDRVRGGCREAAGVGCGAGDYLPPSACSQARRAGWTAAPRCARLALRGSDVGCGAA